MDKGSLIAIAVAAFAAGLALTGFVRPGGSSPAPAPQVPSSTGDGTTADLSPEGLPGIPADAPASLAKLQDDVAAMSQLLKDMIESHGEQRRRIQELEAQLGGGGGPERFDPDTGQGYAPETVWVPEGLGETAMQLLRAQAMEELARRGDPKLRGSWHQALFGALADAGIAQVDHREEALVAAWYPLVREFAAAWGGRDPEVRAEFMRLLATPLAGFHRGVRAEWRRGGKQGALPVLTPGNEPVGTDLHLEEYRTMRDGLRERWRAFVAELPFEVKAQYESWCHPFLKAGG